MKSINIKVICTSNTNNKYDFVEGKIYDAVYINKVNFSCDIPNTMRSQQFTYSGIHLNFKLYIKEQNYEIY